MDRHWADGFLDELEKIAVSEKWIRERAARGALQKDTVEAEKGMESAGGWSLTRRGKKRGHPLRKLISKDRSPKLESKLKALQEGIDSGLAASSSGARLRDVGPTGLKKLLWKHPKKAIALGAAGLAAAGHHVYKKKTQG